MSSNASHSAPFGGDYRMKSDGVNDSQPAAGTGTAFPTTSASRQLNERQRPAPLAQEMNGVAASAQVPHTGLRGPGGGGSSGALAAQPMSSTEPRAALTRSEANTLAEPKPAAPTIGTRHADAGAVTSSTTVSTAAAATGSASPRTHVDPTSDTATKTSAPAEPSRSDVPATAEHRAVAEVPTNGSSTLFQSAVASSPPGATTAPTTRTGTTTTTATPASAAGAGANATSTAGEAEDDAFKRPVKALSVNLVALLKVINAQYCTRQRMEAPGTKYNNGFDDREGHYLVMLGEEILGRYTVQEVLGKGSFGTVVRCYDEKRRETVALKITRRGSNFRTQAKLELDLLLKLNSNPALNHLVVRLLKVFDWQGHLVLAFELLSFNLYQLIKCTRYTGVSLDLVRKFAYQLMHTLRHLEEQTPAPIIHCDIKPENILLRNQSRSGIRLIDFGSACYANKRVHRYIQSRFYRSPEVILYLDYTTAIDRWSVGCVLVELFTGTPLFDGRTEAAQLARFEATLGPLPDDMLSQSRKTAKFYTGNATTGYSLIEHPVPRRSLESVLLRKQLPGDQAQAQATRAEFLDFIARLLCYRPEERLSCRDALQHPFLTPLLNTDTAQQAQTAAADAETPSRTA